MSPKTKKFKRERRKARVRARVFGVAVKPRLSVRKSNAHIYAQLIDDDRGRTLVAASDLSLGTKKGKSDLNKAQKASEVGKVLAKQALGKGVKKVVFDKNGYKYHGRVKALADGAREGGLEF